MALNVQPDVSELDDYTSRYGQADENLLQYAITELTPDLAIAITKLFWPDFLVHADRVFLASRFSEHVFKTWEQQLDGDLAAVERLMNHIHLAQDLLVYPFEDLSYANIAYFGSVLVETWKAALKSRFPDRMFEVVGEKDGDLDDFVITFWQVKKA